MVGHVHDVAVVRMLPLGIANCCNERSLMNSTLSYVLAAVDCGPLPDPESGMVMLMGTTEGSKALYTCKFGFMLSRNMSRTCQSDGQWSGEAPTCKRE